jgi:hypothetical protein
MAGYYLSGSITNTKNFKEVFNDAESVLRFLGADDIFNPASVDLHIPYTEETKFTVWKPYMRYDLKMLADADVLVLLPGWWRSRGAKLELIICRFLGIRVVTLKRLVKELTNGNS